MTNVKHDTPPPASQSATPSDELPELPEPKFLARRTASGEWLELLDADDWTAEMWAHGTDPVYAADQMRAYGQLCQSELKQEIEDLQYELREAQEPSE